MDKIYIRSEIISYIEESGLNGIGSEYAIFPEYEGMHIFEDPLVETADAEDPLFYGEFKQPHVIGPHFRPPGEWVPGAKTVISFFLPFTRFVRDSNRGLTDKAYDENIKNQRCSIPWLHGRIEGQTLVDAVSEHIATVLKREGYRAVVPSLSPGFVNLGITSNWSERHVAYAAGLGTFGLSKGLITKKGMAGRFGSVVTDAVFPVTDRPYTSPFEYCTMCGACQHRCPVRAIDVSRGCALGKDQAICYPYLKGSFLPPHGIHQVVRYGCGKCQVSVPCEHQIPRQ